MGKEWEQVGITSWERGGKELGRRWERGGKGLGLRREGFGERSWEGMGKEMGKCGKQLAKR